MEDDASTSQPPSPHTPAATVPTKRPQEESGASATVAPEKRQKLDVGNEDDAPPDVKAGESSKQAEKRAAKKDRETRRGAKERRVSEKDASKRRGTRPEGEARPATEEGESRTARLPKRMSALLIGFCGAGYNGMQMYVSSSLCH